MYHLVRNIPGLAASGFGVEEYGCGSVVVGAAPRTGIGFGSVHIGNTAHTVGDVPVDIGVNPADGHFFTARARESPKVPIGCNDVAHGLVSRRFIWFQ